VFDFDYFIITVSMKYIAENRNANLSGGENAPLSVSSLKTMFLILSKSLILLERVVIKVVFV
jgi:hypothetical protein